MGKRSSMGNNARRKRRGLKMTKRRLEREAWNKAYRKRLTPILELLKSLCVYGVSWGPGANSNNRSVTDSTTIHCPVIDPGFFNDVVLPAVYDHLQRSPHTFRLSPNGYTAANNDFVGAFEVTWQPDYLTHPAAIRDFWRDYNEPIYEG